MESPKPNLHIDTDEERKVPPMITIHVRPGGRSRVREEHKEPEPRSEPSVEPPYKNMAKEIWAKDRPVFVANVKNFNNILEALEYCKEYRDGLMKLTGEVSMPSSIYSQMRAFVKTFPWAEKNIVPVPNAQPHACKCREYPPETHNMFVVPRGQDKLLIKHVNKQNGRVQRAKARTAEPLSYGFIDMKQIQ